jgi:hypothetical protein
MPGQSHCMCVVGVLIHELLQVLALGAPRLEVLCAMDAYEEIRKLGAGSFGVALLVRRRADGELVVAKRM